MQTTVFYSPKQKCSVKKMKSFCCKKNRLTVSKFQILCELHFVLGGGGNTTVVASICCHRKSLFPYGDDFSVKHVLCFLGKEGQISLW